MFLIWTAFREDVTVGNISVMCRTLTDTELADSRFRGVVLWNYLFFFLQGQIVLTASIVQWLTYSSPELLYAKDIKNVPEDHTEWYRAFVKW